MIRGAAEGRDRDREAFARRYRPVVQAYLRARWPSARLHGQVEDATQEVFVDLFKPGGALERLDESKGPSFRPFLYGVARYVALSHEQKAARRGAREDVAGSHVPEPAQDDEGLSVVFDRAWARAVMREAGEKQRVWASKQGEEALRRVELLDLRFVQHLPIRTIAERWEVPAEQLHRQYAKARKEFERALVEVVAFHHPGETGEVRRECRRLLALLA
jgi:RNA polymerase sigma-70 factor (ECF subfamily)